MFIYCHSDDDSEQSEEEEEESASGDGKNKICPTHQPDSLPGGRQVRPDTKHRDSE